MKGDEKAMFDRHEKQITEDILPRVGNLEKWKEIAELELQTVKNEMKEMKLGQDSIKNSVDRVENTIVSALNIQSGTLKQVLDHSFAIKSKQEETNGKIEAAKITTNEKISIAKLSTREKIIGSVLGVGGLSGLIVTIAPILTAITWPWE